MKLHVLLLLLLTGLPALAAESPKATSVLAYNVLFEGGDLDATLDAIERADPDLLCLTELTKEFGDAFVKRLGKRYPHRAFRPKSGTWGVGLASKSKLTDVQVFQQKPHKMPAIEARTKTGGGALRVACLHLFPPVAKRNAKDGFFESMQKNAQLRKQQAEYLARRFKSEKGSLVLLGDFNEEANGEALQSLGGAGYANACAIESAKCGATYPGATSALPAIWQVDHVLGKGVKFEAAAVIRSGGSDHFPISATFRKK